MNNSDISPIFIKVGELVINAVKAKNGNSSDTINTVMCGIDRINRANGGNQGVFLEHFKTYCAECMCSVPESYCSTDLVHGETDSTMEGVAKDLFKVQPLLDELYQSGELFAPRVCWSCWYKIKSQHRK